MSRIMPETDSSSQPARFFRLALSLAVVGLAACAADTSTRLVAFREMDRHPSAAPLIGVTTPDATTQTRVSDAYGKLPLSFEPNHGQTQSEVKFLSRGKGYTLFLTGTEAVLSLRKAGPRQATAEHEKTSPKSVGGRRPSEDEATLLRLKLVDANPEPTVVGLDELPGKSNYFVGNDSSSWQTGIPTYARVKYEEVYPGVDLVYYGHQGDVEHDFVLAPGTDPALIRIAFEGAEELSVGEDGELIVRVAGGDVRFRAPLIYQEHDGSRAVIGGGYEVRDAQEIGFRVAGYDASRSLVIDPVLAYSTYLGGSSLDIGIGIAVDGSGSAYVTGQAGSTDFPTTAGAFQQSRTGGAIAFVTKLDPSGSSLIYSTYLGGTSSCCDAGSAIAVDASGSAYVAGIAQSTDFPTTAGAFQSNSGGGQSDGFVTKLSPTGNSLAYSTYLGGAGWDQINGVAVDGSGSAYVTGLTGSSNFPTANPGQASSGGGSCFQFTPCADAFVTKFNAAGSAVIYSTYLGGGAFDYGNSIAVDGSANSYVTGVTYSTDFPTASAIQTANAGGIDGFVTKLDAVGALAFSTYLGGSNDDDAAGIVVDIGGSAYIIGSTASANFPTTAGGLQENNAGSWDAFVTKLSPDGNALAFSTYLGGSGAEWSTDIGLDGSGSAYVTGGTCSSDFPIAAPFQDSNPHADCSDGGMGAFVTKLSPDGNALAFSTYLGGSGQAINGENVGYGIAVDPAGSAYVVGLTGSTNFPTTAGAFQESDPALYGETSFVTKFSNCGDGIIDPLEQCDDGNTVSGDGCNNTCQVEPGFTCMGEPSVCTTPPTPTPTPTDTPTPTPTATPVLDHFTCYKAGATSGSVKFAGIPNPPGVSLVDEFGSSTDAVKKPGVLCAPTNKLGEDPTAPTHPEHLIGYPIKNLVKPVFPTNIKVVDQFNVSGLFVNAKKQSHLLVPTVKSLSGPTPVPTPGAFTVDHFECYKVSVTSKTPKFVPVLGLPIKDQFGSMTVDVKKPKFLCNPVDKNGEGIHDAVTHLMCYQVKQVKTEPKFLTVVGVFVNNQFGPERLDVKKPSELCVPAVKNP